ncbi:hypothetical protein [Aestuariibaculum lutulentum]|uniref:Lipoprotein n=1 Tax=Aestuariibaculum lutulentum TaxID=2920935 RepID=A0ABS9RJ45_9FLAO|nr:hypothetical protein [Aestuariibaculum lutulentum]MCH4552907.1 hypothetical protein [Aestuariibaculum lutulentum]
MKNWRNLLPLLFAFLTFEIGSCQNENDKSKDVEEIKISRNEIDAPVNEYLTQKLKPIRENFKRINSTENWTEIKQIDILESSESAIAVFYFQKNKLEKVITRHFGETAQKLTEYYLINGELSFVFEKLYKYNRPIYWDSIAKKENNDNEVFDFEESEIIEDKSYFSNGTLLHQINNQDCGSPFASDYLLEEQERLLVEFKRLIKLEKKK